MNVVQKISYVKLIIIHLCPPRDVIGILLMPAKRLQWRGKNSCDGCFFASANYQQSSCCSLVMRQVNCCISLGRFWKDWNNGAYRAFVTDCHPSFAKCMMGIQLHHRREPLPCSSFISITIKSNKTLIFSFTFPASTNFIKIHCWIG